MAAYTRTTTVDASASGDSVKQAVVDVDMDLTGLVAAYNVHDPATTGVHGVGAGTLVGTTLTQTLTNKTIESPTITGTAVLSGLNIPAEGAWTNYSATSTVTGWAATPTALIYYKVIGKTYFVHFNITGTSNATGASFTLPAAPVAGVTTLYGPCAVKVGVEYALGAYLLTAASTTVNLYPLHSTATAADNQWPTWPDSGVKGCFGQLVYEVA